ncbi:MAG: hypothetical protein U9Q04_01310 [Campylobacterota bacterium]|nr:hypothetical protein [Campylobacterota bacterium]
MNYSDIFILGWNLNAFMFVINLFLAVNIVRSNDPERLEKESELLNKLSSEMEEYYPNRQIETLISYLVPFTAFYRILFKLAEMIMFFNKNRGTKMFDFIIYKYQQDIAKAKSRIN